MRSGAACAWVALGGFLVAGCGGGESARQDADEPNGTWTVDVLEARFPDTQRLAKQETMRIRVRNADERELPNVAVTVEGFSRRSEQAGLADPTRPVWILDDGPRGGTTAYTNTWALGRMAPGATKTFEWRATPVKAGTFRLKYRVAAGLDGKAKAVGAGGRPLKGLFSGEVDAEAPDTQVGEDGRTIVKGRR